jgi:mxaJ protein
MFSRCHDRLPWRVLACALVTLACTPVDARELRVCADPDNLPYSDAEGRGFENRIVRLVAHDIGATPSYYWLPQWRGFTRKTLLEGHCDVIPGVPAAQANVLTTAPYYRGTYALVFRADRVPGLSDLDDARLRTLRVGLPLIGIDAMPTPPGRALARRGIFDNVIGFPVIGERPAALRMITALARDELDVAIVWSPQAGYFVTQQPAPLSVVPLSPHDGDPEFTFAIAMGVRPDDEPLQRTLDGALARLKPQIDAVLREYAVMRAGDDVALGIRP